MALHVEYDFLVKVPIFQNLTSDELEALTGILTPLKFKEGENIIKEGDPGDTMFIFKEGRVQVGSQITLKMGKHNWSEAEKSIAVLDADMMSFFGEMSLITGAPRSATITAQSLCYLYELGREDFEGLAKQYPQMGFKVMQEISKVLCNRITTQNANILKLTTALSIALSKKKK